MSPLVFIQRLLRLVAAIIFLLNTGCSVQNQKPHQANSQTSQLQPAPDVHQQCYEYLYGVGDIKPNVIMAYDWCSKGASAGVADSQVLLAEMYLTESFLKYDLNLALKWYLAAAQQHHKHAQYMLYHLYITQGGRIESKYEPNFWLYQSVSQGYKPAIDALADIAIENNKN